MLRLQVVCSYIPKLGLISPLALMLIPLARSNEADLQALLCIAARRVTIKNGCHVSRQWEVYHRGEAIRLINARLSEPNQSYK